MPLQTANWWDEYIAYLERNIHQLERVHRLSRSFVDLEDNERTVLVKQQPDFSSIDAVFVPLLDQELRKIIMFYYQEKEKELFDELQVLEDLVTKQDTAGLEAREHYMDDYGG